MSTKSIMSYGATDDGTDQYEAFEAALSDETLTELVIEDTPSGNGYAVDLVGGVASQGKRRQPLPLKDNLTVRGEGWGSRIRQIGDFSSGQNIFRNVDREGGNNGITFDGVCVEGKWDQFPKGTAPIGPGNPQMTVVTIAAFNGPTTGSYAEGFRMTNCVISNWPGVALSGINVRNAYVADNKVSRISGGGLIFRLACEHVSVIRNTVTDVCDDAIAFNAHQDRIPPENWGGAVACLTQYNTLSRFNPEWAGGNAVGAVYSIRGGEVTSIRDTILPSPGSGFFVIPWEPVNALIREPIIIGTARTPVHVMRGVRGRMARAFIRSNTPVVNGSPETFTITRRKQR